MFQKHIFFNQVFYFVVNITDHVINVCTLQLFMENFGKKFPDVAKKIDRSSVIIKKG